MFGWIGWSFMYTLKSSGASTLPCGRPFFLSAPSAVIAIENHKISPIGQQRIDESSRSHDLCQIKDLPGKDSVVHGVVGSREINGSSSDD